MLADILNANHVVGIAALIMATSLGLAGAAHADPDGQMYGDPDAAAPYWRYQGQGNCGLMAVADVVGQVTGSEPTQAEIQLLASKTQSQTHAGDIYHFAGTTAKDMVVMLQQYGIPSDFSTGNTLETLEQDLAGGRKVIAGVNGATIWNYPPGQGQRTKADHALVVTGVDTRTEIVHLNDSGVPEGRDEQVPILTFTQAWSTANNMLIVTQATGN